MCADESVTDSFAETLAMSQGMRLIAGGHQPAGTTVCTAGEHGACAEAVNAWGTSLLAASQVDRLESWGSQ